MIYMFPDSAKLGHDIQVHVPSTHSATQVTKCPREVLRHSPTILRHTWVTMPPHTTIPLPHNSPALTHGTTHDSHTLRIKTHQPTTPHVSHMPSHANSHADTSHMASCTWDLQVPFSLSFYTWGAARSQERELQPFPDLLRTLFLREPYPAHPNLSQHSPFIWFQKVLSGQGLQCEAEDNQWRGSSQAVLGTDVGACAIGS